MKLRNTFQLLLLATVLGVDSMVTCQLWAQSFKVLQTFTGADGANPQCSLLLSGNTLYGTTTAGGLYGKGAIFAVNMDGTGATNLYSFVGGSNGSAPPAGLVLSDGLLYGTTPSGGAAGAGSIFAISTNGTGFKTLYSFGQFQDIDGTNPQGGLALSGTSLYGTASEGGTSGYYGNGTIFEAETDGSFAWSFFTFPSGFYNFWGANPMGTLIISGEVIYGTATYGGASGSGTVFGIGTGNQPYSFPGYGGLPYAGLVLGGETLYGTAAAGGFSGNGSLFAISTNMTGFSTLYLFSFGGDDGGAPYGPLVLAGDTLYGTASGLGYSSGTVFAVKTNGTGFSVLHAFKAGDGANPRGGLLLSGNTLYGTAANGGAHGVGTVFSLTFAPQLSINQSGPNIILTWQTDYAGFDYTGYALQSTTNLGAAAVWTTNLPPPIVVNGQNTVTNPISGTQQFYRLRQ